MPKEERKGVKQELPYELWGRIKSFQNSGGYDGLNQTYKTVKDKTKEAVQILEIFNKKIKKGTDPKFSDPDLKNKVSHYSDLVMKWLETNQEMKSRISENQEAIMFLHKSKAELEKMFANGMFQFLITYSFIPWK